MKTLIPFFILLLCYACNQTRETPSSEEFKALDFKNLNQKIATLSNKKPRDIMKIYYPEDGMGEGNQKITIKEKQLKNRNTEVHLIHENLLDDSVKSEKYVMELTNKNNHWKIVALKKNWKCQEGRGHQNWGIELCN